MTQSMRVYERGRNDRRDGVESKRNPFARGTMESGTWATGWNYQDALFKRDREYAYKQGRKDVTQGNSVSPYPVGTTAYLEWSKGYTEVIEAKEKAAAEKAAKKEAANAQ